MSSRTGREHGESGSPPTGGSVAIPHPVAVTLLAPLIQTVATSRGVRILCIKGDALALQGLRTQRASGDVDVLVDPDRFEEFSDILRAYGWRDRDRQVLTPLPAAGSVTMPHARTLEHPHWPAHLDLHRYYPGFLGPADETFEMLWAGRETIARDHLEYVVPSAMDHWILAALHAARSADVAQTRDLEEHARQTFGDRLASVRDRAVVLRASGPLRDVLAELGARDPVDDAAAAPLLEAWRRRLNEGTKDEAFVEQLVTARRLDKLALTLRHLFPHPRSARAFHAVGPGARGMAAFYVRRLAAAPAYARQYAGILWRGWRAKR